MKSAKSAVSIFIVAATTSILILIRVKGLPGRNKDMYYNKDGKPRTSRHPRTPCQTLVVVDGI